MLLVYQDLKVSLDRRVLQDPGVRQDLLDKLVRMEPSERQVYQGRMDNPD